MSKKYKIYDLSQPLGQNVPLWPWPGFMQDIRVERVAYHERQRKSTAVLTLKMHSSTHADAPFHVLEDGITIEKMPLETFYGEGVVVYLPTKKWEKITPQMLENVTPKIQKGDFVVLNTGWHKLYRVKNYEYMNYYGGLYREAAEWFVEKGVKAVAVDQGALDHPLAHPPLEETMPWLYREYKKETGRDPIEDYPEYEPCHKILLGNGIAGYENCGGEMDQVTGKRVLLAGFPIRWENGDASIVRLVAITEVE
ncbi:MAG: cyclase family protein [Peptococcaceae bacterium]|jgi:kynurenine formamidase|nr:cyclase family protein [Peptococcaceae bacterium]MDH7526369.1 cyclase family protein [Peptococcaceae bacterium]